MSSTSAASPFKIVIIGSGLSGLSLALSLVTLLPSTTTTLPPLEITIYESRSSPLNVGGALMLSPNGLQVLDKLGIHSSLRSKGYNFRNSFFQDALTSQIVETFPFGGESAYGYDALRISRSILLEELLQRLVSLGAKTGYEEGAPAPASAAKEGQPFAEHSPSVQICWSRKFAHTISDSPTAGVHFAFTDGSSASADLLIGADGIHSSVRQQPGLYPSLTPLWTGKAGITAAIPTSALGLPAEQTMQPGRMEDSAAFKHPLVLTLQHPRLGGFVIAPQEADGRECLVGRQMAIKEDPGREGVKRLMDTEEGRGEVVRALREGIAENEEEDESEGYPEIVRRAAKAVEGERVNVWPFYMVPKLERWVSRVVVGGGTTGGDGEGEGEDDASISAGKDGNKEAATGRVVILGDAAHAIPPTAGQGVNQALEDVWTFALVLRKVLLEKEGRKVTEKEKEKEIEIKELELGEALQKWQKWRQERVDGVLDMNRQIDLRRMPEEQKTEEERNRAKVKLEVDWLYKVDFEEVVEGLFREEGC